MSDAKKVVNAPTDSTSATNPGGPEATSKVTSNSALAASSKLPAATSKQPTAKSKPPVIKAEKPPIPTGPAPTSPVKQQSAKVQPAGPPQGSVLANDFVPSYGEHFNPPDDGTDDWDIPESVAEHPLFVPTNKAGGVIQALKILDRRMIENGLHHLISRFTAYRYS